MTRQFGRDNIWPLQQRHYKRYCLDSRRGFALEFEKVGWESYTSLKKDISLASLIAAGTYFALNGS